MNSPSNPGAVSSASESELGSPGGGGGSGARPSSITTVVGALDGAGGLVGLEPGEMGAEDTEAALAAQLGIRVLDDEDVGRSLEDELDRGVDDDGDSTTGRSVGGHSRDGAIITSSAARRISLAMTSHSPGVTVVSNLSAEVGVSLPVLTSLAPSAMLASPSTDAASNHDDDVGLFDTIAERPVEKEHDDASSQAMNDVGLLAGVSSVATSVKSIHAVQDSESLRSDSRLARDSATFLEQPQQRKTSIASPPNHQPCYECPFCKCSLNSAQALNTHIETHINRASTSSTSSSSSSSNTLEDEDGAPNPKKAKVRILFSGRHPLSILTFFAVS